MPTVDLTKQEWDTLMALIGNNVVWVHANPLLMKIGEQLRAQQPEATNEIISRMKEKRQ